MKKIIPIFLGILLLYFVVNGLNISWLPFSNSSTAEAGEDIGTIDIHIAGGSTVIIPEDRTDVSAELNGKGKAVVKEKGERIEVTVERRWYESFPFYKKGDLKIYIPDDYTGSINLKLGSGNLRFSGLSPKEPMELNKLTVDVGSGNTKLENLSVNRLTVDESSGSVEISSMRAKHGTFDISSGSTRLENYTGGIEAELSSGKFSAQLDDINEDILLDVSSGEAVIDLPADADFTLKGEAGSGQITSSFPLKGNAGTDSNKFEGTYGSGKNLIEAEVSSGSIDIR
ncbi:DUF4097 family beta strand repeat-containing protein [Peribacillus sp. SCS-155]|uniref:DUF4097 family beta strand repeat-containing protein n=1 Tax=Peribacillus sedimenti TaxID=3115297 RepID=UPI003905C707